MKRTSQLLIVLMLLMATVMVNAQDDPVIPNLAILEEGEPLSDQLDVNNILHARLYMFGASEGDVITIDMDTSDEDLLDPFLMVFGASGQLVAADDDSGGAPNASVMDFDIPEDGTYYVLATSYATIYEVFSLGADLLATTEKNEELVSFDLTIKGNTNPDVDPKITVLDVGDAITIEISDEITISYVAFMAEKADVVDLSAVSDDVDTLLYLFDVAGNLVVVNDDAGSEGNTTNSRIANYEILETGIYMAFVTIVGYDSTLLDEPLFEPGKIEFTIE